MAGPCLGLLYSWSDLNPISAGCWDLKFNATVSRVVQGGLAFRVVPREEGAVTVQCTSMWNKVQH